MSATLSLSAFEFMHGLSQSETAAIKFADTVEMQGRRTQHTLSSSARGATASAKSATQAGLSGQAMESFKNAGYAVQDFTSQINNGVGPAMNAVSNNLMQMAAAIPGPWKAAAIAVAVAAPLIISNWDKIRDSMGFFSEKTRDLNTFSKEWDAFAARMKAGFSTERELLDGGVEKFDKHQQKLRDEIGDLQKVNAKMLKDAQLFETAATPGHISQDAVELRKKVAVNIERINEINAEGKNNAKLRDRVLDNERNKEQLDRQNKMADEHTDRLRKGVETIEQFRMHSLEKYGTEREKLDARLERERNDLVDKTEGLFDQSSVLSQFDRQSEVERKKLGLSEMQKRFAETGSGSIHGPSSATTNSIEGIQAINRAITGNSQSSQIQKQIQLAEQEVKNLEKLARLAEEDRKDRRKPGPKIVKISG